MPITTFSRRKSSKRQNSSDIEDDRPSQIKHAEPVDDDDERGTHLRRRVMKGVKNVKKPITPRQQRPEVEGGEDDQIEDEDDRERIDIENFRDQPLGKMDIQKLQGIGRDWLNMEKQVRQNWKVVGDVAVSIAETAERDDAEQGLAELDKIMRGVLDIGAEMQFHEQTLNEIAQKVAQGEDIDDAVQRYNGGVNERMEQYAKKTARQKYARSEQYASFKHGIYEVQFPDQALPPITNFIPKEDGDDSDDDDELEMGGVIQGYTCPITLVALENPVTSEVCGHSFSADAIRQTFRGSPMVKCPTSGCTKQFKQSDLKPNKELAKKVKAWVRRSQRAAEHSDAEEIID